MKKWLFLLGLLLSPQAVHAQAGATVVLVCGTLPQNYSAGATRPLTVDITGVLCSNASGGGGGGYGTIGSAVPATGVYNAINVAGTLRGWTGAARGSEYAASVQVVDGSGNQITTFGTSAAIGSTGAAVPGSASYVGFNSGGNLTGISSSTPLPVTGVGVAQGSTTSGQTLAPIGYTTCASLPTYTTAQTNIPCLTTEGATIIAQVAAAIGGATPTQVISAASNNSQSITTTASTLYSIGLETISSSVGYLKVYDKATAPTCGTDTPKATYLIPVNSTAANGAGQNPVLPPMGLKFSAGIGICIQPGLAVSDVGTVAASSFIVNLGYK